jgi:hypothetical protein
MRIRTNTVIPYVKVIKKIIRKQQNRQLDIKSCVYVHIQVCLSVCLYFLSLLFCLSVFFFNLSLTNLSSIHNFLHGLNQHSILISKIQVFLTQTFQKSNFYSHPLKLSVTLVALSPFQQQPPNL